MDLHDYADVAANYDYYLPSLGAYHFDGFCEFHANLAKKFGNGGILDIACGTGALTELFAESGYDVMALDLSASMIDVTKEKLSQKRLNVDLLVANMTDFKIDRKFSLAVIARGGFMHLLTAKEQRQALRNIKEHLADDGILTFNHFQPHPVIQAERMKADSDEYVLRSEYVNHEGKKERIFNAGKYDYITQILHGVWKFETLSGDDNVIDTRVRPAVIRHTYRQEMEYLLELCGYEIVGVYNSYRCDEATNNFIWVVKSA